LGLALVKSLVEMHDGAVVASSAGPGLGCRFDVKLPRLKAPSTSTASKKAPLIAAHRQLHVLIVDDNADAAWVLATCLEGEGHEVTVCHTPTQALERAALGRPDACLLDIGLPEMDGCELVRRLRELPGMQAVLMAAVSGYSDQQIKQKANDADFDHYFVKPLHIQQIIDLLTQASPRINTPDDAGNI
jgi:CheY-like chemotaxis protein